MCLPASRTYIYRMQDKNIYVFVYKVLLMNTAICEAFTQLVLSQKTILPWKHIFLPKTLTEALGLGVVT